MARDPTRRNGSRAWEGSAVPGTRGCQLAIISLYLERAGTRGGHQARAPTFLPGGLPHVQMVSEAFNRQDRAGCAPQCGESSPTSAVLFPPLMSTGKVSPVRLRPALTRTSRKCSVRPYQTPGSFLLSYVKRTSRCLPISA